MLPALPLKPRCCRNYDGVTGSIGPTPMNGLTGHRVSECGLRELSFGFINTTIDLNAPHRIGQNCKTIRPSMLPHPPRCRNPLISKEITAHGRIAVIYPSGSFTKSRASKSKEAKVSFPIQHENFSRLPVTSATGGNDGFTRDSPAQVMRRILETPGVHQGPACFDALSAKLVEKAGFQFCFMSGFSVSATRLALPDVGLISYGEMVDQGSQITGAVSIPVIGDGDNGYGNALNVKRTVKGYIGAGFAGILLEDQVSPKACGHTHGREVVSREEAVMRIKAAVDARKESSSEILIIAQTDARQAISLEESLWRVQAFANAGADVLFIDALASKEEMQAFCNVAPQVPKMANMLEGGGKTPVLSPIELEEIGFKIISYPLSLLGVSIRAMQDALSALKSGRIPRPANLPSFEEIKEIIGFNDYYEEEERYCITGQSVVKNNGLDTSEVTKSQRDGNAFVLPSSITLDYSGQTSKSGNSQSDSQEGDVELVTPYVLDESKSEETRTPLSGIWARSLRVKITARDGFEKLDVRIPAGFLEGLTNIIPGVAGLNLKSMLDEAAGSLKGDLERGKKLIDISDRIGDRIQVFLE